MDFVSGVSSTYDFSVYAQRKALASEDREKASSVSSTSTTDSTSKTEEEQKVSSASKEKTSFKVNSSGKELSEEEKKEVEKLKARDMEVRQHEQAHQRAGAGITGQAQYTYKAGPDKKQYAVGGSVPIDMSEGDTPQATISKAEKVRRTALAPKDPSSQDMKVAQEAAQMETEARSELLSQSQEAAKSYTSVKNIATSRSAAQPATTEATGTETEATASSSGSTPATAASSTAKEATPSAGKITNPYAELSTIMSDNSTQTTQIKASNTKKLDLMTGKAVDLFG